MVSTSPLILLVPQLRVRNVPVNTETRVTIGYMAIWQSHYLDTILGHLLVSHLLSKIQINYIRTPEIFLLSAMREIRNTLTM